MPRAYEPLGWIQEGRGKSHGMPDASYVGERSTSQEGRIPYRAESGASSSAGYAKGGTSCRGKAVVAPKPQSVHVDATLKVTVNVETAEAPVKNMELCWRQER